MGDHRAYIKIELEMYGHKRTYNRDCNWVGGGASASEISQWFEKTTNELYETVYAKEIYESQRRREERDEREQYERLKKKFEP